MGYRGRTGKLIAAVGATFLIALLPHPASAQQHSPAQATAHALDELANAIAQGKITRTPTPTSTPRPQPTDTMVPAPTDTPIPEATATTVPTPVPSLPAAEDPVVAYLRPANDPWMELALPTGRWLVQGDCDTPLAPWSIVSYHTEMYAYVDDCALTDWQWTSALPCAHADDGPCDLMQDASYWDFIGTLPTATPTETPFPTDTPKPVPPTPIPVQKPEQPVQPVQAIPEQPVQTPQVRYVQAAAQVVVRTMVVTATPSITPTRTVTGTPTSTRTATPTVTPTVTPTAATPLTMAAQEPRKATWFDGPIPLMMVAGIVGGGVIGTIGFIYFMTNR